MIELINMFITIATIEYYSNGYIFYIPVLHPCAHHVFGNYLECCYSRYHTDLSNDEEYKKLII